MRYWTERDELNLLIDLQENLLNQNPNIERLARVLRDKDQYGNDQVPF